MNGQMTIRDWLQQKEREEQPEEIPDRESLGDKDIDEIVRQLDRIAWMYKIKTLDARLTTWAHVPNMGRRLTYGWIITREHLANRRIWKAVGGVVDYADEHGIDLEPMTGAIFFFDKATEATLRFYSHFRDARKKIKGKVER